MTSFEFETDDQSRAFCEQIAGKMVELFGISQQEAIGRINRDWRGLKVIGCDIINHEDEAYWANTIYYGKGSNWWLNSPNLKSRPIGRTPSAGA
jgi:hypothetical protein